jgi:hypothetical protein
MNKPALFCFPQFWALWLSAKQNFLDDVPIAKIENGEQGTEQKGPEEQPSYSSGCCYGLTGLAQWQWLVGP